MIEISAGVCAVSLMCRYASTQFEQAAKLTGMQEPAILEMLAAAYSDTGRFTQAIETARRALDIATQRQNDDLATRLRASLGRYQALAQQGKGAGATQ